MTEEVKAEMLPCPFCGSEAEMSFYMKGESKDVAGFYVECCSCSAGGEPFDIQGEMPDRDEYTKSKAIAAWNSRTPSTEEMVKVLEEAKSAFMAGWLTRQVLADTQPEEAWMVYLDTKPALLSSVGKSHD